MKKSLLICLIFFLLTPSLAFANGAGLPSFFSVNGKLSTPNPLQLYGITSQSFLIPQDFTPENYVVNQPINFAIDEIPLQAVIQPALLQKTKYVWDYGDGSPKADGLKNTHTYTKPGSYILILTLNIYTDPDQPPTQFIDSYFLNVLPNKNYNALPKAVIKIDNQEVTNPLKYPFEKDFRKSMTFDSSASTTQGGKITAYLWNFGDGQTSTEKSVTHTYASSRYFNTVVLRVKDSNGFISDAFVGIKNTPDKYKINTPILKKATKQQILFNLLIWIALFILLALGVFVWLFQKNKQRK